MFPLSDSDWIAYISAAVPNNVSPCWLDIVGDPQHPAAYYALISAPDPTSQGAAFRMRLNGNPGSFGTGEYRLKGLAWGVEILTAENNVLYTALVNAEAGVYALQVLDAASNLVYEAPIDLDPLSPRRNVAVTRSGIRFPCMCPAEPDEDWFLDFAIPDIAFGAFRFSDEACRLCYFTSTQGGTVNRDSVTGALRNPPSGVPILCVTKEILAGPASLYTDSVCSWLLAITVKNEGTVPAESITLADTLSSDLVMDGIPVFIPSGDVSYEAVSRVAAWNMGTIGAGETAVLAIRFSGSFSSPGHYILDAGVVAGPGFSAVSFADRGVLVYAHGQLKAECQIVSGPLSVERCRLSAWTLRFRIANSGDSDMPDVNLCAPLDSSLVVESTPALRANLGTPEYSRGAVRWVIDNLPAGASGELSVTVMGFLSAEGHTVLAAGTFSSPGLQTLAIQDGGVEAGPLTTRKLQVRGVIEDYETGRSLRGVLMIIYDNSCKKLGYYVVDCRYDLELEAGIYTLCFRKEGYQSKFLTLVLQSDADILADVRMAPHAAGILAGIAPGGFRRLDLFTDILCDKVDADIVYSSTAAIAGDAAVETLDDVIDSYTCSVVCSSKLHLLLNLEKNMITKRDGAKEFQYFTDRVSLFFPLRHSADITDTKCVVQVRHVTHCRELNVLYNIARLRFIGYTTRVDDVLVQAGTPDNCCDEDAPWGIHWRARQRSL